MIVAILLAYLDRIGQRKHFKDVVFGVVSALVLAVVAGTAIFLTVKTYADTTFQQIFETVTYIFATIVMTYMTFWMSKHARDLTGTLRGKADGVFAANARFGLAAIAFQAVGRESLESMVFTLAIVFASSGQGVIVGGIGGLLVSLAISFWIYRMGRRLNVGRAFKYLGIALMVFSAGLLVDAIQNLQELGVLSILSTPLWNTTNYLSEQSTLGDIVHTFLGYADRPTALQLIAYVIYLGTTIYLFVMIPKKADRRQLQNH